MKKYLSIKTQRANSTEYNTQNLFLIEGNVTGITSDNGLNSISVHFANERPYSFARIYLKIDEFLDLARGKSNNIQRTVDGVKFYYSVLVL